MDQKKQQKLRDEHIESIDIGKVFHACDQRNQWVDWNGNTDVVRRAWGFALTLDEAEQWTERNRVQGTSFQIEELPAICVKGKSGSLFFTERNSSHPMNWFSSSVSSLHGVNSIGSLIEVFSTPKANRVYRQLFEKVADAAPADGLYYLRKSSPGKGKNHMGWSLKPQNIDDTVMRQIVAELRELI